MSETSSDGSLPSVSDDPVTRYAHEIVSGERPAGKWHRLACERHLRDLAAAERGEFAYRWRVELANKGIGLFKLFRHYKGEWAGQPIVLDPWECFIVGSIFGWVHADAVGNLRASAVRVPQYDGRASVRRFRNAFCELPRGSGKSTLAAGLLLIFTFFDGEPGAEGYCFATKKDQAQIVFRTARQMVLRSVVHEFVNVLRYNLHNDETESKLEALGADADTLDGLRPHCAVGDEIHKHGTPEVIDVIESGMGPRRQPLLFNITTAGESDGTETAYGQQLSISTQVLEGFQKGFDIPEWFAFIAAADIEDDWTQEATWIKANPAWGVSVKPEFLRKELAKALANPAEQPKFRRLYLGQKVQASDAYLSLADWDACPGLPDDDELRKWPCWIGLDLSSSVDITAMVLVWRLAKDEIAVRPTFWVPEEGLEERRRKDKVPYPVWESQNWLKTTPGNTIDRTVIRRAIAETAAEWKPKAVCFDPWHAGELTQALQDEDKLTLFDVGQRFAFLSQPTKDLQAMVLRRRVRHAADPAFRWMASNLKVRKDDKDNVMPCKRKSRGRIDGFQALITALNQVLVYPIEKRSGWSSGGAAIVQAGSIVNVITGDQR